MKYEYLKFNDMKKIRKTIGLIVMFKNKEKRFIAALQTRGNFNTEKNKQETYKSASQLTVHGGINEKESEINALLRETKEELGKKFAKIIELNKNKIIKLNRVKNDKISAVNFGLMLAEIDLDKIKINKQTDGSLRLISKNEISNIRELKPSDKTNGIANKNEIAMFFDDIETVKLAFKKLTK
ncbi:hypothetical protein COT82_01985 [Candidatus Campbellbacteria bacterium CG10_big_fil_rev_8_21_14_0_10_35_52]|uniref:Nudix hydrolase domain-containing protein n=1 Tax=Candidatus Campbellbacteria bacterium CG10_big_fil_rev_8_21_14_0_10_35_52 TaxID=1974527 RepID=A0A2M6WV24_9BACT|nr:MAG: hypothetical protein COT82_01985 [Candidatus Campbellbacteria bacterium CG10_big_fil_rev_8_21_14_0_10_35_52]